VLITLGILVLLFVVYLLWGTGLYESQAQGDLQSQFQSDLKKNDSPTVTTTPASNTPDATTTTTLPAPTPPVPFGDAVAHLVIPKIGVDKYVVQGVGVPDLRKGPGHYPETPMPGQLGTAAIAGHRTTYGAPFWSLSDLVTGDKIEITTLQGSYTYTVVKDPFPVDPHDLSVLDTVYPAGDQVRPDGSHTMAPEPRLTLTTCNPRFSASQRLVVQATLDVAKSPPPAPAQVVKKAPSSHLGGTDLAGGATESKTPAILWGLVVAAVGGLWWLLFHRHARWTTWLIGAIPFAVVLFVFFTHLDRALPSNY
jgi:sortase A